MADDRKNPPVSNRKSVRNWAWGKTTTRRDARGRKKPVAVRPGQVVVRERTSLRIIEPGVWDRAARIAELNDTFGGKAGQKPRGPHVAAGGRYGRVI